ncbi:MAG TPA: methyltransferase domain-containing protein [Micrococcaceae bacterium]|jgi:SAM-dependent methyltransferase|nr:methyltransferase domain-containing protein [Micrococcaceae bacterium]
MAEIQEPVPGEDRLGVGNRHHGGQHQHGPGLSHDAGADGFSREFYDRRYGSQAAIWSGKPNPQLVTEIGTLSPGAALDVGCGEGADAIWLAGQGWRVTAVDFSAVALQRAAQRAADNGPAISQRIEWLHRDLSAWSPTEGAFDLVSAQFLQLPRAQRGPIYSALAQAVAPGGTLLIVGHDLSDQEQSVRRPPDSRLYFTAEELVEGLPDPDDWKILTSTSRPRQAQSADGQPAPVHDVVLRACKNSGQQVADIQSELPPS